MRKLFIYYSFTGNGKIVSDALKNMGYEIREVKAQRNLPNNFFLRMMIGGMLSLFNHKAKLLNYNNDISDYDEIVIGSPIWNGRLSCPINTVLKKTNLENKKVKFILYSGGGEVIKATSKLKTKYNCEVISIKEPKKNKDLVEALNLDK